MGVSIFDEILPRHQGQFWQNGDVGTEKDVWTNFAGATRIDAVWLVNTDTIDHDMSFLFYPHVGSFIPLPTVKVPAGAGNGTVPAVELFTAMGIMTDGLPFDFQDSMTAIVIVDPTSGKFVYAVAIGGRL